LPLVLMRVSPELFRLKAEMLLALPKARPREAEQCLRTAIAIAQQQATKFWELRVTTSLARLWARQARRADARDLLAPVHDWFTEGFALDLKQAKSLLDELAQ
jgi:predicted ATPase